jgi:hypothetical protein
MPLPHLYADLRNISALVWVELPDARAFAQERQTEAESRSREDGDQERSSAGYRLVIIGMARLCGAHSIRDENEYLTLLCHGG